MAIYESGYEGDYLESPPSIYECPVCLLVLREPHLLSCCGVKICNPCVSQIQGAQGVCPVCRERFTVMMDKQLNRSILALKVRCPLKLKGCLWIGELRNVDQHVSVSADGTCEFVQVQCRNGCGHLYSRKELQRHEEEKCHKRAIDKEKWFSEIQQYIDVQIKIKCNDIQKKLNKECDRKLQDMNNIIEDLQNTTADQERDITRLNNRLRKQKSNIESMTSTISKLEEEIQTLKKKGESQKSERKPKSSPVSTLEQQERKDCSRVTRSSILPRKPKLLEKIKDSRFIRSQSNELETVRSKMNTIEISTDSPISETESQKCDDLLSPLGPTKTTKKEDFDFLFLPQPKKNGVEDEMKTVFTPQASETQKLTKWKSVKILPPRYFCLNCCILSKDISCSTCGGDNTIDVYS